MLWTTQKQMTVTDQTSLNIKLIIDKHCLNIKLFSMGVTSFAICIHRETDKENKSKIKDLKM